jgi:hypothetical protein
MPVKLKSPPTIRRAVSVADWVVEKEMPAMIIVKHNQ